MARNGNKLAVAYKRVSSQKQTVGTSRTLEEDQPEAIERIAEREGLKIVEWFDDVLTGTTNVRQGLLDMLSYVETQGIGHIIAYKQDRLTREPSMVERGIILEKLIQNGTVLLTTDDRLDPANHPDDALKFELRSMFDAIFVRDLKQRLRDVWRRRHRNGVYTSADAPFGLRKRKPTPEEFAEVQAAQFFEPDPDTIDVLHGIFDRFTQGQRMKTILDWLNTSGPETVRGNKWKDATVKAILRNNIYIGLIDRHGASEDARNVTPVIPAK